MTAINSTATQQIASKDEQIKTWMIKLVIGLKI